MSEVIRFDCNGHNAPAYGCNKPGDNSGEYVKADHHAELVEALRRLAASHRDFMEWAKSPGLGRPDIEWSQEIEDQAQQVLADLESEG